MDRLRLAALSRQLEEARLQSVNATPQAAAEEAQEIARIHPATPDRTGNPASTKMPRLDLQQVTNRSDHGR
jgi:hypothetical protein